MPEVVEEIKYLIFGKTNFMKYIVLLSLFIALNFTTSAQGYRTDNSTKGKKSSKGGSKESMHLGKNILTFSPVQVISTNQNESPDVAISFAYERIFKNDLISFKLPVSASLVNNYYYIMPVLKLYPMRQGISKYAVGPQFLLGVGDGTYQEYVSNPTTGTSYIRTIKTNRRQFGFLLNNSLNFTVAKALYIGLDASLGIIYYDTLPDDIYSGIGISPFGNNTNIQPALNLNFNMGFRF